MAGMLQKALNALRQGFLPFYGAHLLCSAPMQINRKWRIAAVLAAAWLVLCTLAQAATPGEVPVGGVLREAQMHGLNGPDRRLSQYRGKPLLINVWASWCGPCRMEMGSLERLAWNDQGKRFAVIGISTDDSEVAAKRYLQSANATLNHYLDHALELEHMLGADRLPLTLLVDGNGRVLGKYSGAREWDNAESARWLNSRLASKK
jgi:thiol-disulfide isomerase/thioredoxin